MDDDGPQKTERKKHNKDKDADEDWGWDAYQLGAMLSALSLSKVNASGCTYNNMSFSPPAGSISDPVSCALSNLSSSRNLSRKL
jgi:hypothetical protein